MEIIEIMDRKTKIDFPFLTEDGEEVFISAFLFDSPYGGYLEILEAFLMSDPTIFVDEDFFLEEDLERMVEEAEDFLDRESLYR